MTNESPRFPELLALDVHRFRDFARDRDIRRGISWFRSGRIVDFAEEDDGLVAVFDGGARDEPGGTLKLLPPETPDAPPAFACTHVEGEWSEEEQWGYAVAAVLAYQATRPVDPAVLANTADRMRLDRLDRGRQEVAVRPAGDADDPGHLIGNFLAQSVGIVRPGRDAYRVQVRSLTHRINGCTCPDFQQGGLGICKHIAAALLRAGRTARRIPAPTRARMFRAFDDQGRSRWGVLAPARLASRVEDGQLVDASMRRSMDDLPRETLDHGIPAAVPNADDTMVWLLPDGDPDRALALVERWSTDPDFDLGEDILRAVDAMLQRRQRALRRHRVTRELDEVDGEVPGLHVRPFPYQWKGIRFLVQNGRALLADDMGLGKTMQAIAATTWMRDHGEVERTIIVCPTSLLTQWADEFEKFTGERPVLLEGGGRARRAILRERPPVVITTYDRARLDYDTIRRDYAPDLLIVDEAQRVKNWATRNAQYITALHTPFAFILSGTPLENKLEELYALMQLVDPDILGPLWRFTQEFCVSDLVGLPIGYRNLVDLRTRLSPVLLRRTRNEVLEDLPERIDTDLHIPLSPAQRDLHDQAVEQAQRLGAIRRRRPLSPQESKRLLSLLQAARMACNAATLVDEKQPPDSPKIDTLLELLEELCLHEGRKVVVFSEWIRMAELCIPRIRDELGLRVLHLHGSVPSKRRGQLMEDFNTDPRARVFFSSDAGGVGLNLQAASALIHLDCPWNPAVLEQRSARVHRHGQTDKVQIIRLLARDAYEEHVANLVETKRALFDATVSPDAEVDTLGLGTGQLDKALEALERVDTPPTRAPAGIWKDSAQAISGTIAADPTAGSSDSTIAAAVSPTDAEQASPHPDGTLAGASDGTGTAQDSHSRSRTLAGDPTHEALATRVARLATALGVPAGVVCEALLDLLGALGSEEEVRLGERRVFVRSAGGVDPADHAPLPLTVLGEVQWEGAVALLADIDGADPVDLGEAGVRPWLEAHRATDRDRGRVLRGGEGGDAPAEVLHGDDAESGDFAEGVGEPGRGEPRSTSRSGARRVVTGPDPSDARVVSAEALWGAGQGALALRLMVEAHLDAAAAALGVRLPGGDDTWRWIYAEALPAGALTSEGANALALSLAVVRMGEAAPAPQVEEAWWMVREA